MRVEFALRMRIPSTGEMDLPRTFVSFSSADIHYYRNAMMWNENEHIDFNFADFQLMRRLTPRNPYYIRTVC